MRIGRSHRREKEGSTDELLNLIREDMELQREEEEMRVHF